MITVRMTKSERRLLRKAAKIADRGKPMSLQKWTRAVLLAEAKRIVG